MQPKKLRLIAPSNYQERLCTLFSSEVYHTNKDMYSSRNQTDENKVRSDIYLGKMAEFAVYNYLISKGKKCSSPDILIYEAKQKSYEADLFVNGSSPLHVKSCMDSKIYSNSWVFQPNDPLVISPTEDETIALVIVKPNAEFDCYIVKALDVLDMYRAPRKIELNKKVLYEEDFIQL
jgi:hypothetical protein